MEVELIEVGPRDGLQNEAQILPTSLKLALVDRLMRCGFRRIEVASFVHPDVVPQMADAESVCANLPAPTDGFRYIGLVLNERGLDRALTTEALQEIGCVAVATDSFGKENQRQTVDESVTICQRIMRRCKDEGLRIGATISVAFGCPFEGMVVQQRVIDVALRLAEAEPNEICLADTIGAGVPAQVQATFEALGEQLADSPVRLRAHFHNTRNTAIANAEAAWQAGVRTFDASVGGIGGCPFAPRATGNVASEDLLYLMDRSERRSGILLEPLIDTAKWLERRLDRALPGQVSKAGRFP